MLITLGRHQGSRFGVGHFWSLCVEEQFYLVWPVTVWFVRRRATLLRICIAYILGAPLLRIAVLAAFPWVTVTHALYLLTPFRLDTILAGAALALWLRDTQWAARTIVRAAQRVLPAAALLFALCLLFTRHSQGATLDLPATITIGFTLIAIAGCAVLVLALDEDSAFSRTLQWKPLAALGRVAYGLYFFHELVLQGLLYVLPARAGSFWLAALLSLPVTIGLAYASYYGFEQSFLRLKARLAPRQKQALAL